MSFPENTPMHFGLHWPCADQLFGGYYAMEMHPPQLQIAQTLLQLWKKNLSYKSYGLLLIWPTGFHWGSEFDTWRPWCFRNPAKKFTTSGGDCFIPKPEHQFVFENFAGYQKFKAMNYWTEWLLQNIGGCCPPKKHLPNSTQKSSPETQITLV